MIEIAVLLEDSGDSDAQLDNAISAIEENLEDIAEYVAAEARASSEFADKTGKLRKSIKKRKSKFEGGGFIVYTRDPKAHLVEYGHVQIPPGDLPDRRVPAHPFLRQALEKGSDKAVQMVTESNK